MISGQLDVVRHGGKAVGNSALPVTSTLQQLLSFASNGGSKRAVRRWFEHQDAKDLRELKSPIFGLLVRFSHPKPRNVIQGAEFQRLVGLYSSLQIGRVA